ncbi:hypothetical protein [Weissella confusa]|uniref:hypothetical protein n=1 Tax=Weissella confusa TaxID=1583 RepID=UPI00223BD195|nr:hypothetical protein [Weissella confusa]MCT0013708.1 hypothetical protein [Weissella confusa]
MTVTVSFDTPQIQVNNSSTGIQLSQVILPYSIRNSEDYTQYLGGQMTLGQADGIKLTDNTKDWERLGLAKIKNMVADAEIYVPDTIIEVPASSASVVASSAADSVTSSEATVASSAVEASASSAEAPVSSASVVASSVESQVTTAPSESTTEA